MIIVNVEICLFRISLHHQNWGKAVGNYLKKFNKTKITVWITFSLFWRIKKRTKDLNLLSFANKNRRVRVNCSKCNCSNLDCSTLFSKMSSARHKKHQLLDRQKYAVTVPHFVFKQLIKKVQLLKILSSWQNFCDSKK